MPEFELPRKITALVTPFKSNQEINWEGFRANVRHQVEKGWAPLVLGTTGEAPCVDSEEFDKLVTAAIEETQGRNYVIVGTGTNNTRATVDRTRRARELGADIGLVVMPYYNKPAPQGQEAHFRMAASTGMPIFLYDVAGRTAKAMDLDVIAKLSEHPNIIGYKAATHEIYDGNGELLWVQSTKVAQEFASENFRVWSGDDGRTLDLMKADAYGVISVASIVAPEQVGDMVDAAARGDYAAAEAINAGLSGLFRDLFIEPNPIPAKAAMNLRDAAGYPGMNAGYHRLPMTIATDQTMETMEARLGELGLL